ncbi:type III restriction enzyme [Clostridioides phage CD2301]|uniref:DEAD/DEAH box helicase family protein n=1 Tax=Clostridioides difficile TaxID=1496 RepID=A0AAN6A6Z3_CLODI|nr:DEAD/DEAH box helicase family protein [Clostridioides difficile]QVW56680.1 type III restriction enzyme [Clostridioides phage CD2301]MCU5837712.1 DEAD/DEAH box helicase family protein [Clostridioides difficile]HAT4873122.1 DEAD/DEAH box helicase family protein [Clostridioides difficile]HAT6236046.1 DEAD/DEAH box helicase family protein [Clostridioides difficile]HBF1685083.1 DEAD/DEAH box helicase family protein [Clostridioides difficile]
MKNNIDKLFKNECDLERATGEIENYAKFERQETHKIKKYIDEKRSGVYNAIARATAGEMVLLIAETGTGKSYSFINALKKMNIKALFILPNSANVEQAMKEYNVPGAYDLLPAMKALKTGDLAVMTWDKTEQLLDANLKDYIIIVDEIHQTYTDSYRSKAIKNLNNIVTKCKGRIDITATPTKLEFNSYDYIVEYIQEKNTKYDVTLYNNINLEKIIEIINKSENSAVLYNNKKELKYIKESVLKKSDIIHSKNKAESELYKRIMQNSDMKGYELLLNTTTILAGVNIKNKDITDIVVAGFKDPATIKQYVARFRDLKSVRVHIFNNYEDTEASNKVYEVNSIVNINFKRANKLKELYNELNNKRATGFETVGIDLVPFSIDSNVYYSTKNKCYEIDKLFIISNTYARYYNSRTIASLKILLEEYFKDVKIENIEEQDEKRKQEIKEYKEVLKEIKKATLKILEENKKYLVGYEQIKRGSKDFNLMSHLNYNEINEEDCKSVYIKHDIDYLIKKADCYNEIELFSKYVLENNYSLELSWKLANMGNNKRNNIFKKINNLIYRELKEEYPNLVNDNLIEVVAYNYIDKLFGVGTAYTKYNLQELSDDLAVILGDDWKLAINKLGTILKNIFIVKVKQHRNFEALENYLYYKNNKPNIEFIGNDRIQINKIERYITIEDIEKELKLEKGDLTLRNAINIRKKKLLNNLDEVEKAFLNRELDEELKIRKEAKLIEQLEICI